MLEALFYRFLLGKTHKISKDVVIAKSCFKNIMDKEGCSEKQYSRCIKSLFGIIWLGTKFTGKNEFSQNLII